ncbi:ABC transporter ATP-binding protein [Enterococcus faecalis]|uniref:ABC transporter ATP-binding protein n=1 Tax=Enterococcus faecalis TaxID=1351 RepID=UPI00155F39D3|nr:ABC transporter ATP-binding protein [Enterococcus faecalis]NRC81823.1 ABC transporter ATP-binding protein [Enterococcus faecalis]NSR10828.1 ABC transporter ATP-binding protein [Enterococcus faecalis]NSS90177.1 ABC transporter ATP-binding protein [Enterococcus faecalis]
MIKFQNVSKVYKENAVLSDVNLTIQQGEFFVLVGPSGSGKTTTLKMINRLIEPTTGEVALNEQAVTNYPLRELRLKIGYVLQQIALFPNLTVAENIELIPEMKKWPKEQRRERTIELLKKVQLDPEEYLHRKPAALSGGEQQRIGILRAIAAEPEVILMDEPFSALDPISRHHLQRLVKELHQELASTIVFVTHDMNEALLLGERICIMDAGKIIQVDTPEAIQKHPKNNFVGQFFKQSSPELANYCGADLTAFLEATDETIEPVPTVFMETNLKEIVQLINAQEKANLVEKQQVLGCITSKTITRFMEQLLESEGQ